MDLPCSIGSQRASRQQAKLVKAVNGLNATRVMVNHAAACAVRPVGHGLIIVRPNGIELRVHLHHNHDTAKRIELGTVVHAHDLATGTGDDLHDSAPRTKEGKGKARPMNA